MEDEFANRFATVKAQISLANFYRTQDIDFTSTKVPKFLSFAMGEVNANPDQNCDPSLGNCDPFPWDFEAGQFLAFCAKNIMKHSGEFICPWSVYESRGDEGNRDFSLYDPDNSNGTTVPRSTMWHLAALAQNRRGYYMEADLRIFNADFEDKISVVGMTDENGSTLMIMNATSGACKYSVRLNDNAFATGTNRDVKIKVSPTIPIAQGDPNLVHSGTIGGNETIVYVFDAAGNPLHQYEYNATMATPPVLDPPLRVASVNPNPSGGASTSAIEGNDKVNVYPVPTQHTLNVDNAANYKSIQIYNNAGRMVYIISNPNQSKVKIDLSGLASGNYYMHLKGDSETVVKKLIKY
jgi:Secretion system C-terminal sorting domain